jgi:hypothetical protein
MDSLSMNALVINPLAEISRFYTELTFTAAAQLGGLCEIRSAVLIRRCESGSVLPREQAGRLR